MTGNHVLVWALTTALLSSGGVASDLPQTQDIQMAQSDLEQPGPDHRLARENAVKNLLSMSSPEAHGLLKNRLVEGDDPDQVSLYILGELQRRVSNPNDDIFGLGNGDTGRNLIRSYVPALVSAFIEEAPTGRKYAALRDPALSCLRQMPALARKEGLDIIIRGGGIQDLEMRKAALRAAARCRDLGLAKVIAIPYGDGDKQEPIPALLPTAREALKDLTFRVFRDQAAFKSWWDVNGEKTYLDIVEEKAMLADASQAELQDLFIKRSVKLVEAWVAQKDAVKWREIHKLVLEDHPPGLATACLQKLREILADNPHEGNSSEQRLEFHNALIQRLQGAADDEEKALLLETAAYLIRPQEEAPRSAMEVRLLEQLQSPNAVLRLAALHGLRRFPSPANRAAVVQVALDALSEQEEPTLRTALTTLHGNQNWHAPAPADPDHADWLRVVRQVFNQFSAVDVLGEGLDVALLDDRDGAKVPEVFDLLLELVDSQTDMNLRLEVLVQLRPAANADNAARYVAAILDRLDDESPQIRQQAAVLLSSLPPGTVEQRAEWDEQINDRLRERLLKEPSPVVFKALMAGLSELGQRGSRENVIGIFKEAIEALPESAVEHRQEVVERLAQLGLDPSLEVGLWQIIAATLLEQGQRDEARSILVRQKAGELSSRSEVSSEAVQNGMDLLIRAALLKPAGDPPHSPEEARQVLAAFDALEQTFKVSVDDAPSQLLRLRLYQVLGDHARLIHHGAIDLADTRQILSPDQRDQVTILMARAFLGQDDPQEAWRTIERLGDASRQTPAALQASHEIAEALLQTDPALAADILTHVVAHTQEEAAQFRVRFLDLAQARLIASTTSRTEVRQMLMDKQSLFASDECPQQVRQRYNELLKEAGN